MIAKSFSGFMVISAEGFSSFLQERNNVTLTKARLRIFNVLIIGVIRVK